MIRLAFAPNVEPLEAEAVAGQGSIARALVERLLRMTDEQLTALRGVSTPDRVVIFGAFEKLPWVDGVTYLGRSPEAPRLYLPTTLSLGAPLDLLERRVAARMEGEPAPWLLLDEPPTLLSVGKALPLVRAELERCGERLS